MLSLFRMSCVEAGVGASIGENLFHHGSPARLLKKVNCEDFDEKECEKKDCGKIKAKNKEDEEEVEEMEKLKKECEKDCKRQEKKCEKELAESTQSGQKKCRMSIKRGKREVRDCDEDNLEVEAVDDKDKEAKEDDDKDNEAKEDDKDKEAKEDDKDKNSKEDDKDKDPKEDDDKDKNSKEDDKDKNSKEVSTVGKNVMQTRSLKLWQKIAIAIAAVVFAVATAGAAVAVANAVVAAVSTSIVVAEVIEVIDVIDAEVTVATQAQVAVSNGANLFVAPAARKVRARRNRVRARRALLNGKKTTQLAPQSRRLENTQSFMNDFSAEDLQALKENEFLLETSNGDFVECGSSEDGKPPMRVSPGADHPTPCNLEQIIDYITQTDICLDASIDANDKVSIHYKWGGCEEETST